MRKKCVAGNWKMIGSRELCTEMANAFNDSKELAEKIDIVVCPPSVYLHLLDNEIEPFIKLGAQNMHFEAEGAYTGEISAQMLLDLDCRYVIIGHSERRELFGETDEGVAKKAAVAVKAGLTPILCVGESLEQREQDKTFEVLEGQISAAFSMMPQADWANCVVAYEPIWAIGTGKTATPEQAQEVHAFLRGWLREKAGTVADSIRILYGGSVKPENAKELFSMSDIDGGLVGGASLKPESFLSICQAATE